MRIRELNGESRVITADGVDNIENEIASSNECRNSSDSAHEKGRSNKKKRLKKTNRCNIGGQAVLEGVMMLGSKSIATAVRDETGKIQVESSRIKPIKEKSVWRRVPFVRGVLNFGTTMYMGVKILLRSSAVFDGESEPTKFEKWCAQKLHIDAMSLFMGISVLLGVALAIGLFFVIPHFIGIGLELWWGNSVHPIVYNLIEGVVRIIIFVAYVSLAALMKEIKRTFMYHGAEHKTIACYEYGLPLTVENVQKQSTIHDRCGTTFMFIVMVISILVFSFTGFIDFDSVGGWSVLIELLIKLALLPVVAGISYEILKLLAKFDNAFVRIIKAPGLLLQKVTTKQPTDDMVEVAITAFQTVLDMDNDDSIEDKKFDVKVLYKSVREEMDAILSDIGDGNADADWIATDVLGIRRSELSGLSHIKSHKADEMLAMCKERASGKPLQQILGNTEFYGLKIKVDERVLCPRPETEYLVEAVSDTIKQNGYKSVLDLCTGSGAIAVALKYLHPGIEVTAGDISEDALCVARENALSNETAIEFVSGNLFENIDGKYDVIVSNPPYIKTADITELDKCVKDYEPVIALDGGETGLDYYKKITEECENYLNPYGCIAFETGIGQTDAVTEMLLKNGFSDINVKKDLEGVDRIIVARKQ